MAPVTPSAEPTQATSGDTWTWTLSSAAYPVSEGWVLSYVVTGVRSLTWTSGYVTSSGETRTVVVPTAATALPAGRYEFTRIWTGAGSYTGLRYTEALDPLTVLPNPAAVVDGDRVSFAEKNLEAVEAAITARVAGDQPEEYSIGSGGDSRSVRKMELSELLKLRSSLQAELKRLRNPGFANPVRQVRFSVPGL